MLQAHVSNVAGMKAVEALWRVTRPVRKGRE